MEQLLNLILVGDMRAIGNGIGIPFRRNTGQGVIWPPDLKSALVCWYSPRKQKLTEYDVIESYVENFTNWNYVKARGAVTISQHKFIITECIIKGLGIVEDVREPYSNLTVRITGITDNQGVLITDYVKGQHQIINTITEDGIYTIEDRHHLIGFGCNFVGTCNITIKQLPTSILKDFSGNGLDAYMYGFQGKLNSGMGVYKFDFLSDLRINSACLPYTERQDDKICSLGHPAGWLFQFTSLSDIPAFKVEVKGIVNDNFTYRWYDENGNRGVDIAINEDGIYELPMSYSVETNTGVGIVCNDLCQDNVYFTQLPDYPNQLCYSGKEYCISFNQPILTDYTVIADRTWFENPNISVFSSKGDLTNGAFIFERIDPGESLKRTVSFGSYNNDMTINDGISYQSKNSYNGSDIVSGTVVDANVLCVGAYYRVNTGAVVLPFVGCHSDFLLFNRTLTQEEIDWVKNKIFKI